jgi:hypothetical protein
MSENSNAIPDHERPIGRIMAEAHHEEFRPIKTLDEAKQFDDGVVILEGDDGGQVYLTCPARMVHCSQEQLQQLLLDIDAKCWQCNENEGARIYFERKLIGSGVWGGMGGGVITGGLWLHFQIEEFGIRPQIEIILAGKPARII